VVEDDVSSEANPARLRRQRMLDLIRLEEFLSVAELGERFSVSYVTVRTDLDALARRGLVRRIRGGAMSRVAAGHERAFEETELRYRAEKATVGRAAAELVTSGETVILDVGTTTTEAARALAARTSLAGVTVMTSALNIALELEPTIPRMNVIVLGGTLRPMQHSLVDPLAALPLAHVNAHTLLLGCNGVDPVAGVTSVNLPEADVKRRLLAASRRRIVLADGSKLGTVHLARLCRIDEIDAVVTGTSADPGVVGELRERGVDVLVAT
jgi:DeoR family transcriptional regulator of aga operon